MIVFLIALNMLSQSQLPTITKEDQKYGCFMEFGLFAGREIAGSLEIPLILLFSILTVPYKMASWAFWRAIALLGASA